MKLFLHLFFGIGMILISSTLTAQTQRGIDIDGAFEEAFGKSVAMNANGNIVAFGADTLLNETGQVYVYQWNGTAWNQKGNKIIGDAVEDAFGTAISMSDDGLTIAISANGSDIGGLNAGLVRVYNWNGINWTQKGQDLIGEAAGDRCGRSVAISANGNRVVIGADQNAGNGINAGHVRVYSWNGAMWTQLGLDIEAVGPDNFLGYRVAINNAGTTIAMSAPFNSDNGYLSGQIRVFTWNGSVWTQQGQDIQGEMVYYLIGTSLAFDSAGVTLAVGEGQTSPNGSWSGQVRVFDWDGTSWVTKGISVKGGAPYVGFGNSVALSNDGNVLGVGGSGYKLNTVALGVVRTFTWETNNWVLRGSEIVGENEFDVFGSSVAMNSTGNTIAGTSVVNDDAALDAGHIRIYDYCRVTSTDSQTGCGSFTWIDGKTYTANNNTAAHLIYTAQKCDSVVTLNLTFPSVNTGTSTNIYTITANQDSATYQWLNCGTGNTSIPNQSNQTFTPTVSGSYAVIVTYNGCSDTSTCVSITNVGVIENQFTNVKVYPNPTQGLIQVELGNLSNTSLTLYNSVGEIVFTKQQINASSFPVSITQASGFYILKIEANGNSQHFKILKE